nr:hypothetical protein [uncultured Butyrivibrio sp.]
MSNRQEFDKIRNIVGAEEFPEDKSYMDDCFKKFLIMRNLMYISVIGVSFLILQENRVIYINEMLRLSLVWGMLIITFIYIIQKRKLHQEINRYLYRECRPDVAISRHLSSFSRMLNRQILWSYLQYNIGCGLFRLGEIDKASRCLALMQESCKTAGDMLYAEHLRMLIALYYNDYDLVISSANEGAALYQKARHSAWHNKVFGDMQKAAAYAQCCKAGDYRQAYSILLAPNTRPLDEVTRHYYLFLAAKELHDFETMEKCREYVRQNAGTTWYGRAVEDKFAFERKPSNYPGFVVSQEIINKPKLVDRTRLKYALIGALLALAFYLIPQLMSIK